MNPRCILLILIAITFAVGCLSAPSPTPAPAIRFSPTTATSTVTRILLESATPTSSSTPIPSFTPTRKPTLLPIPSNTPLPGTAIQPIAFAASFWSGSWSLDSRFLAYWTFTAEQVKRLHFYPPATLHFLDRQTGEICVSAQQVRFSTGARDPVLWLPNGQVLLRNHKQLWLGTPCRHDFMPYTGEIRPRPECPFQENLSGFVCSPKGTRYAVTHVIATEQFTAATTVVNMKTRQAEQVVKWKFGDGEGDIGGPIWIDEYQLLFPYSEDRGPLLVTVGKSVVPVAKLAGLSSARCESTDPCNHLDFARVSIVTGTSHYHLLLTRSENEHLLLYHSENGKVEELPFFEFGEFSPDGRWMTLLKADLDRMPIGYGTWIRAVDPAGSEMHPLSRNDQNPVWSPDSTKMAIASRGILTILAMRDILPLGSWNGGGYQLGPWLWTPDGEFLAALGGLPGPFPPVTEHSQALFIIPVP